MSLQPKTRKYRNCFRNKTRICKDLLSDKKNRKFINANFSQKNFLDNASNLSAALMSRHESFSSTFGGKTNFQNVFQTLNLSGSFIHFATKTNKLFIEKTGPLILPNTWQFEKNHLFFDYCHIHQNKANFNKSTLQTDKTNIEKFIHNRKIFYTGKPSNSFVAQFHQNSQAFSQTYAAFAKVRFGTSGFYFCSSGTLSAKFLETIRLGIARKLKKSGRFWIRVCADTPVTARSAETRMGRGKGAFSHYEAKVRPGQMFLEFSGVPLETIKLIFKELSKKTPVPVKIAA